MLVVTVGPTAGRDQVKDFGHPLKLISTVLVELRVRPRRFVKRDHWSGEQDFLTADSRATPTIKIQYQVLTKILRLAYLIHWCENREISRLQQQLLQQIRYPGSLK